MPNEDILSTEPAELPDKNQVKLTAIANSKDTKTSSKVLPKANIWKQKVSTKISDYPTYKTGYKIKSISYKGNKLVIKGYTYNTFGMKMSANIGVSIMYSKATPQPILLLKRMPLKS